jgi:hypothetical protein
MTVTIVKLDLSEFSFSGYDEDFAKEIGKLSSLVQAGRIYSYSVRM